MYMKSFSKLADMSKKCSADSHFLFSRDVNTLGQKTFFAVVKDEFPKFESYFEVNNHCYEIIPSDQVIRPYFDLEIEDTTDYSHKLVLFQDWLSTIMESEFGLKPTFIVLDSCTETKLSYHMLITNYKVNCTAELKSFVAYLFDTMLKNPIPELMWMYGNEQRTIFDKIPYGSNQNFRMIHQSKYGKETCLKSEMPVRETMISCVDESALRMNCSKFCKKKTTILKTISTDGMDDKQLLYKDEFMEYMKFNMLNDVALKGNWESWRNFGFALFSTFGVSGLELFDLFSQINTVKYNKQTTFDFYTKLKIGKITFNSIRAIAKKKDKVLFNRIFLLSIEKIEDRHYAETDQEASEIVLELLEDSLIYSGRHYYKQNNIWIHDQELVHNCILNFILSASIFKVDAKGNNIPYWQNYPSAEKLVKTVLAKSSLMPTNNSMFHTSTKFMLCFQNGVLDFRTKKFTLFDDINFSYFSVVQIPYDYRAGNPIYIKKIVDGILEPMFGDELKLGLHFFARSMAGCTEDKNFATYKGNRNCGKGVFYKLMANSFGGYIAPVSLSNLLCSRTTHTEVKSVELFWLLELEFARLGISQEAPSEDDAKKSSCKLKSDLIKKICSGGDTQIARRNFDKRDTSFTLDCSLMAFANSEIDMDNDVKEHCIMFESAVSFKDKDWIENMREEQGELAIKKYRVANPNIKSDIDDIEYSYAMVQLLLDAFSMKSITVETEFVAEDSIITQFLKDWEIIPDKSVAILCSDLTYLGSKIKSELSEIGIENRKHTKRDEKRNKHCYYGIQRRVKNEEVVSEL